jgi:hypothetical protein
MDDGYGVTFTPVYEGQFTHYTADKLQPGISYSFYVTATNFNGEGSQSTITRVRSCVRPIDVEAPTLVETTATTAKLRWTLPDAGGCTISEFRVFSDRGDPDSGFVHELEAVHFEN